MKVLAGAVSKCLPPCSCPYFSLQHHMAEWMRDFSGVSFKGELTPFMKVPSP
jgi:hypothetical protein